MQGLKREREREGERERERESGKSETGVRLASRKYARIIQV